MVHCARKCPTICRVASCKSASETIAQLGKEDLDVPLEHPDLHSAERGEQVKPGRRAVASTVRGFKPAAMRVSHRSAYSATVMLVSTAGRTG